MRTIDKLALKELLSSISYSKILLTILHIIFLVGIIIVPFLVFKGVVSENFGSFIIAKPGILFGFGLAVEFISLIFIGINQDDDNLSKFFEINLTVGLIVFSLVVLELILVEFIWNVLLIESGCIKIL